MLVIGAVVPALACFLLLPGTTQGQSTALPKSPGAALRSGWQIAHFAVGYAPLAQVTGSEITGTSTLFGTDEVHYYVLRKDGGHILCYSQLVMRPGAASYHPWNHECMVIG